jgi:hypothetical protein
VLLSSGRHEPQQLYEDSPVVQVAAMREVCRVRGWEIPSKFSLNPPDYPAVLTHWRVLIELLGLMPPRRE